ncbi:hypothetical protein [Streptomyces virginiae]|uniref:hypothetical protein n=1 Tax=Streptomyces virginiae TaxID=1961 RepID=UPI002255EBC1|nr:hypothetical protein [Streptomyces virginiae]MCX4961120.1 hypothetical protein [Streptomyces virginiae]
MVGGIDGEARADGAGSAVGTGTGTGTGTADGAGGPDWQGGSNLLGVDRPDVVLAAFERGEPQVGVAVIGLALNHADPAAVLPLVARALESTDRKVRRQGVIALAHVARLHRTVDRRCLELLRRCPRGNEADDDLWSFVPHRELPLWLWRHHVRERLVDRLRRPFG